MCGICGIVDFGGHHAPGDLAATAAAMSNTLAHRGPDSEGVWADTAAGVALGHRRLAIVDLTPTGRQPMVSADGRYVITYNGEIYNFPALRAELETLGRRFRGRSDTEALVEACAAWGVESTARRLIGIFAFALWDRFERRLFLVRDHLGVKPLYYGWFNGLLIFGSELKALRAHPGWPVEVDRDALAAFLRFNYVPAPYTIYRGVSKLQPGSILTAEFDRAPRVTQFWDAYAAARAGLAEPLDIGPDEATDQLESLLSDAVARQMISDVPLGAFLSGGIDSSSVVALMQAASARPVRTFTIGFTEAGFDEARHAKQVAAHLGTDHTELYLEARQALDLVPRLPDWFDEPFADSSQLPTYLVSAMTRERVTVALSGDGGDELFAGYNRYLWSDSLARATGLLPLALRRGVSGAIRAVGTERWDRLLRGVPSRFKPAKPGDKLHKLADVLVLAGPDEIYRRLVSHWDEPERLVPGAREPRGIVWDERVAGEFPNFIDRMQLLDTVTYLPDDILTKLDRASMAVGLEARVPLLDHRVVEFAWRLPRRFKRRGRISKWLLRQVLYRHVPPALVERPKMGFGVPLGQWLRGPLRDWAEALVTEQRLTDGAFIDPAPIRQVWEQHQSNKREWGYQLWGVLMFQAWHERWMGPGATVRPRETPPTLALARGER